MGGDAPVELVGLTKRFGRTLALDHVSLRIEHGEVLGYLGPNGAGKTTTIRLLTGLLRPTEGRATIYGLDCWRDSVAAHRRIGYVPGDPSLYRRLTGHAHVEYVGRLRGEVPSGEARALAERLDLDLGRPAGHLSRGNRQKLAVVLAWMSRPDLLVLDEPTSGLDPLVQREFDLLLHEHTARGGSVLLSSHVLGEVQRLADRIGVLRAGRLVAVEHLQELMQKSLHRFRATFADPVSAQDFGGIAGVRDVQVTDHTLTCQAPQGALDQLLKRVATHRVEDVECTETELEETFLTYYGTGKEAGDAT